MATLFAVPNCRPLIDMVLTDDALLSTFGETLDKEGALLGEVLVVAQKVFEVVFNFGAFFNVF